MSPQQPIYADYYALKFHPVILLPEKYEVLDLTRGLAAERVSSPYAIGRYDEQRGNMYTQELFQLPNGEARDVHVGIDIGAPVDEPVHAFASGRVYMSEMRNQAGDYGGSIITEHQIRDKTLWVLFGHLSEKSVRHSAPGRVFARGQVLGWIGDKAENGGWDPHVHIQLSWRKPEVCDMPGVVRNSERAEAIQIYPDPRLILGPIY